MKLMHARYLMAFFVWSCVSTSVYAQEPSPPDASATQSPPVSPAPPVEQVAPGASPQPPPPAAEAAQSEVITNSRDLEKKVASRVKAPFMLPNHIYMKLKRRQGDAEGEGFVDESVEPQRRWSLRHYNLVGIIWNVSRPKAMITDKNGTLFMFYVGDKIGNNEGQITAIHNGEVVVREKGSEIKMRLGQ